MGVALASGDGVRLTAGVWVSNQSGGTITGKIGVYGGGAAVTVVNVGRIGGNPTTANGIQLVGGGWVSNQSGGTISGYDGIQGVTNPITVVNAGAILGNLPNSGGAGVYLFAGGSITNQAGGTISGYYAVNAQNVAVTVVNAGVIAGNPTAARGAGIVLGIGGAITNQSGGTISGLNYGVELGGAGSISNLGTSLIEGSVGVEAKLSDTVTNAGTIASTSGAAGTAVAFSTGTNRLIVDPNAVFVGSVRAAGTTTLELASGSSAGTLSGVGTSFTNFTSLVFDTGAQWTVSGNDAASGLGTHGITGFTFGDTIDLTGFVAVNETFTSGKLVLGDAGGAHDTLAVQGSFVTGGFGLAVDGSGGTDITVICFAAGTLIDTPAGEVQVEKLAVGDLVMTAHSGPRAVRWIGKGKVLSTRGRRTAATPVTVRKGALGPNQPHADLRVTKAHALYIDELMIPVEFLVNYRTILWDDRAQEVEIFHVELDSHDVLIANGVPAESFRNDGNRWLFQNAYSGWDLPPQEPYAPVLTGGPVVDAVWRRLLDRSGARALPPLTDNPDLHLIVDGRRVDAVKSDGLVRVFRVTGPLGSVHLASRDVVPAELGLVRDTRSLGVALRRLAVRQGTRFAIVAADDVRLADGFHDYEAAGALRWTNGYAALPVEAFARFEGAVEVVLTLAPATTTYVDDGCEGEARRPDIPFGRPRAA